MDGGPTDIPESEPRRRCLVLLTWSLPFLVLGLAAAPLLIKKKASVPIPAAAPLVSKTYPDGATFEIFRAELGHSFVFDSARPEPDSPLSRLSTAAKIGVNKTVATGTPFFDFKLISGKRVLDRVECKLRDRGCNALFLLVRLSDAHGDDVISDYAVLRESDRPIQLVWDANQVFSDTERVAHSTFPKPEPLYRVEVEDGAGGWLDTDGPLAFDATDGRSVVIASVIPRKNPKLKLRAFRKGSSSPVVVEIPNPGFTSKTLPSWEPDPEPWEYRTSDGVVAVKALGKNRHYNQEPLPWPEFEVRPASGQAPMSLHVSVDSIEDEWGNRTPPGQFRVLPGLSLLKFHCGVGRTRHYQWTAFELNMVAKGIWSGKEPMQDLDILPDASDFGIDEMTFGPVTPPKAGEWTFTCKGRAQSGNIPNGGFAVFVDGAKKSAIDPLGLNGGSSRAFAASVWTYELSGKWQGTIDPGQEVVVGLVPTVLPGSFSATLPIPPDFAKTSP